MKHNKDCGKMYNRIEEHRLITDHKPILDTFCSLIQRFMDFFEKKFRFYFAF